MVKVIKTKQRFMKVKKSKTKKSKIQFTKSISSFLGKIQQDYDQQTSVTLIPQIHKLISKYKKKLSFDYRKISQRIKICQICDKWSNIKDFVQCTICEDYYHSQCLKFKRIKINKCFSCPSCTNNKQIYERCYRCKSNLKNQMKINCSKCKKTYDYKCFNLKRHKCKICLKIEHFENLQDVKINIKNIKKKQRFNKLFPGSSKDCSLARFLFKNQLLSNLEVQKYKKSLLNAIELKKMLYTEELIIPKCYFGDIYQTSLDFGIQFMRKDQIAAYQFYKLQPIGPYLLQNTLTKGFDVIADKDIPAKSIICQYIGQVVSLRQCVHLSINDSSMQLQRGKNSNATLIIRPEKFTNMARFINGVNDIKKANVETIRIVYKERPVVLLIAKRQIKKGESLCYDYNAGNIKAKYDTSSFI